MTPDDTPADHGLTVQGPYEPDWWCLTHQTSGNGAGCPDCSITTDPS